MARTEVLSWGQRIRLSLSLLWSVAEVGHTWLLTPSRTMGYSSKMAKCPLTASENGSNTHTQTDSWEAIYMDGEWLSSSLYIGQCQPKVNLVMVWSSHCGGAVVFIYFTLQALEIELNYRAIFSLYLRRLGWPARRAVWWASPYSPMASQINTTQLSSPIWGSLRRSRGTYRVIASDEVFISLYWRINLRTLHPHSLLSEL